MSTNPLTKVVNDLTPIIRFFAGCLGIQEEINIPKFGLGLFPKSMQEHFIACLTEDICRAYSGEVHLLTTGMLIGKVSRLLPLNSFRLERELEQCAIYCVPWHDDLRPHTALLALNNSRLLNNKY